MHRFAQKIFVASGLRTPFGRGGGALADHDAISLSVPLAQAMAAKARPDLVVWGTVIPSLGWSNIGREIWLDAGLDPTVPAFSAVLACSTSMIAAFAAAGMLGGSADLALVGGAEVMSNPSIGLTLAASKRITKLFRQNPAEAMTALRNLTADDLTLPTKGWANRITGRTMGDHMEETAKIWSIGRAAQDDWALKSHQRAVAGWERGFFDDLVIALPEISRDANPRADTSAEKLAALAPAFDKSGAGSLTAGNSSPITDGAAALWVATEAGLAKLPADTPYAELVDHEIAAVDHAVDGLLMAPSFAIARLLARHGLKYGDIALWEIHEAFAAQVLANIAALEKPGWTRDRVGLDVDFGQFPWDRVNPNGGSVAIGHPFAATGARDLSQAVKELWGMQSGSRAIVSICADGGHGTVALLERP
ncbi:thiolase family protein [Sphingomonas lycopersici]|uniref:Acetyl-CoA C-acyltransferase n=1 Tax=Sphingomonas lycopersici TaxID=2951807 RepID=A0AA41ZBN8_9SPHN|nr:acetyl-CoA C-acyltransferase [Sphingomonas lycopersici]MCW6533949.1 acetyl-CoA C-acyltransferase [Sphingomonas lycopersici]